MLKFVQRERLLGLQFSWTFSTPLIQRERNRERDRRKTLADRYPALTVPRKHAEYMVSLCVQTTLVVVVLLGLAEYVQVHKMYDNTKGATIAIIYSYLRPYYRIRFRGSLSRFRCREPPESDAMSSREADRNNTTMERHERVGRLQRTKIPKRDWNAVLMQRRRACSKLTGFRKGSSTRRFTTLSLHYLLAGGMDAAADLQLSWSCLPALNTGLSWLCPATCIDPRFTMRIFTLIGESVKAAAS